MHNADIEPTDFIIPTDAYNRLTTNFTLMYSKLQGLKQAKGHKCPFPL